MNLKILAVILGLLFAMPAAYAATKNEIAKCAAMSGDGARLVCYDNLAASLGVEKPVRSRSSNDSDWQTITQVSPIDDSKNVVLTLKAESSVRSGYDTVIPVLVVRCSENTTNVYIVWDLYLGLESTTMLTRLDKDSAESSNWSISTDNKAVFVQGSDVSYAQKLMKHEKLLAQITPYGESPVMATFHISGLSDAIEPLRKACHW